MGFDHQFMFYRDEMIDKPRFDELQSLPYVTLVPNNSGSRKSYYNQYYTERQCLSSPDLANAYDWVMLADVDEFLRFPVQYQGVKEFLLQQNNMTYLSFGKFMYTLDHRTDVALENYQLDSTLQDPPFPVTQYPFYMKYFCYNKNRRGAQRCPTWTGKSVPLELLSSILLQ
jgi:hypothetical protein